ncbi:MAG TPA: ATP-binding protein [Phototrophicaceae bacterium]|nr:ATP-binding protein [Phototrophicaceae bacterium]
MNYTLLIFRCDQDRLERLNEHLISYNVVSVTDLDSTREAVLHSRPDALIAPINIETLTLFRSIVDTTPLPERPLLVLVAEVPKADLPADLVLPARWIDQPLYSELRLRGELLQLRQRLEAETAQSEKQFAAQKRAAEEVDLLKNAIVRSVSHELKTPLLQVKAAVAMLSDDSTKDHGALVGYATNATARLEGVIMNVTQLADSLEIKPEPVQSADAIEQALRNLRRSWGHKDEVDRVQVIVPRRLPLVSADRQGLGIVLQLLIDNALKFSHKEVEVSARVDGRQIVIAIRDYGIGIPADKLDVIFDPFYQIDSSDTRSVGGLGVGLAIVRLILQHHNVEIKVESELGVGSTFYFALPRVE